MKDIILKNGIFSVDEISIMIGVSQSTVLHHPSRILNKLNTHCKAHREGKGKNSIYTLSGVPTEPIPENQFGKKEREKIDGRSDKGKKRGKYKERKEYHRQCEGLTRKERNHGFDGFYVYKHVYNNEVVYVGKGCRARAIKQQGRFYDISTVESYIVKRFEKEEEALKYEEELIQYYKEIGECKYNSNIYKQGNTRIRNEKAEERFNKKVEREYNKMFKYSI